MFLNSTPLQYTPRAFYAIDNSLIDNDVNYYDFQKSKEYQDVYDRVLSSPIGTMEVYVSKYFGQGSGAYRELDRVYEAYKVSIGADKQVTVDPKESEGFDPDEYEKAMRRTQEEFNEYLRSQEKQLTPGINPMLILAAVAAYFIAG